MTQVRFDGELQGGVVSAKVPDWIAEGATAFWDLQGTTGDFLDSGDNLWDVPRPAVNYRHHTLFPTKHAVQMNGGFGTAAHADARITSALSIGMVFRHVTSGESGIFCYSTGLTDCLWGLGLTASGLFQIRDKRHSAGAAVTSMTTFAPLHHASVIFGTRDTDGSWDLIVDGNIVRSIAGAAAPSVVGDEVIAIGGRNEFDHIGLWTRKLSISEVRGFTKKIKPLLSF